MVRGIGARKSAIGSRSRHEMSKDESGIQYLQKGGFRAKRRGDAPLMSSSCRMALCWFQTIRREQFIESALEGSSKRFYPFGLDPGYSFKVAVSSASAG